MLETFRTLSHTWLAKVVLALVTIPFALFGVEYYFRQGGGDGAVLEVDGQAITQQEFREALRNQQRQNSGGLDQSSDNSPALRYEALNALVNRQLLLAQAKKRHLEVPDPLLVDEISRVELFQNNGHFSQARYEQVLKNQGMTPSDFEQRLRADLKVQLEQEALVTTSWVPNVAIDAFLKLGGQMRALSSAVVSPTPLLTSIKLAPATARQYYNAHLDQFRIPDQVDVQYLMVSADQALKGITVTPDEIRLAYEDPTNRSRWAGQEKRRVRHILLTVPRGASAAQRKVVLSHVETLRQQLLAHPEQFSSLAQAQSQDPGSASQGGELGYFARGVMTPPFENAAFSLKQGELSQPVETDFGYHLIQVEDIQEGQHTTLAQATPKLTQELQRQKANQVFSATAEAFTTMVYEQSGSLEPALHAFHLTLQSQQGISQGERNGLWASPKLQEALFSTAVLKDHRNTPAIEVSPGTLVAARVSAFHPAHAKAFEEVSAAIEKQLIHEEAVHQVRAQGEAWLKDLRAGKNVTLTWSGERLLSRQQAFAGGIPGGMAVAAAFQWDEHRLPGYVGATTPDGDYVLVRISAVEPGTTSDPALRKEAEAGLTRVYGDEVMGEYVSALRHQAKIHVLDKSLVEGTPAASH